MEALLAVLGLIVLVPVIITLSSILNGWVLSILWGWFVVPVFELPELAVAPAIGIALVVSYLTHQTIDCQEKERSTGEKVAFFLVALSRPLFALFFGWIVHMFV